MFQYRIKCFSETICIIHDDYYEYMLRSKRNHKKSCVLINTEKEIERERERERGNLFRMIKRH